MHQDCAAGGEVVCFGHSVGGTLALAAEIRRPGTFVAMFVYEPVIVNGHALSRTVDYLNLSSIRSTLLEPPAQDRMLVAHWTSLVWAI